MDSQQMMDALDIIAISAIKEPKFKARLFFKYKNGIEESIDVEDDPHYIGHKDMLEEAINNYLSAEFSKLRELKINNLLND
jgi:hypothetical protein